MVTQVTFAVTEDLMHKAYAGVSVGIGKPGVGRVDLSIEISIDTFHHRSQYTNNLVNVAGAKAHVVPVGEHGVDVFAGVDVVQTGLRGHPLPEIVLVEHAGIAALK